MLIATPPVKSEVQEITLLIIGVLAASAVLGWAAWRFIKTAEDPKRLRRKLLLLAIMYVLGIIDVIYEIAKGREPITSLVGLPIALLWVWWLLRTTSKLKSPPM